MRQLQAAGEAVARLCKKRPRDSITLKTLAYENVGDRFDSKANTEEERVFLGVGKREYKSRTECLSQLIEICKQND